jgi:hypothetical protein
MGGNLVQIRWQFKNGRNFWGEILLPLLVGKDKKY